MVKLHAIAFVLVNIFKCLFGYPYSIAGDSSFPNSTDLSTFKGKFESGIVLVRGDAGFNNMIRTWNHRTINITLPIVIVTPKTVDHIKTSIIFAKQFKLRISVTSTGHHQDVRNLAKDTVHIDMKYFNEVTITEDSVTPYVKVGTGQSSKDIYNKMEASVGRKWILPHGADVGVGPYGWATGGGHGRFTKQFGLGADNVLEFEIVNESGNVIIVNESANNDLFWALRGSGGSAYGIAISMKIKIFPNNYKYYSYEGIYGADKASTDFISNWINNVADNLSGGHLISSNINQPVGSLFAAYCFESTTITGTLDSRSCDKILKSLKDKCIVLSANQCNVTAVGDYYDFIKAAQSDVGGGSTYLVSTFVNQEKFPDTLAAAYEWMKARTIDKGIAICYSSAVLGGVSKSYDTNNDKTAIHPDMRNGIVSLTCATGWVQSTPDTYKDYLINDIEKFAENVFRGIAKSDSIYWNEANHNAPNWQKRYWTETTYNRLSTIKTKYDPNNVFTCYHCVGFPGSTNATDPIYETLSSKLFSKLSLMLMVFIMIMI